MHNHNPKNAPITPPFATPHEAVCVKVCPRQVPKAHHTLNTLEPGTGHCARRTPPPCMSAPLSENLPFDEDEPRHRSAYSMHAVHTVMGSPFRISPPAHHRGVWGPSVISHDRPPCVEREVSLESRWFADRHLQNTIWCSQRKVAKAGHAVMLSPRKHTTIGIVAGLEGSAVQVSLQMIGFIWQRLFATFPGTHERPLCISE